MRVAINYEDGSYSMYDPTQRKFADGVDPDAWMEANTIIIPESEWRQYKAFLERNSFWQRKIRQYSNMIHERKESAK